MDVLPLIGTAIGAVIALSGALLADVRRDRRQSNRDRELERRGTCVNFVLALDSAHAGLREVARTSTSGADRWVAANRAVHEAGLYGARERLLMSATAPLVETGEAVFLHLIAIRNTIREGARINSQQYHNAYHPFAEALWQFRMAVRIDFRQPAFMPASVDRTSWSEREDCPFCASTVN